MTDIPAPGMMKDGMAAPTGKDMMGWLMRGEVGMALGVIGVILLLILPIPKFLLDLLLAISLASSSSISSTADSRGTTSRASPRSRRASPPSPARWRSADRSSAW